MSKERVEMRLAYAWDCPNCGIEHFTRGLVPDFSPEELEELEEEHGVGPEDTGYFVMMPTEVQCSECSMSFNTVGYPQDEEEF